MLYPSLALISGLLALTFFARAPLGRWIADRYSARTVTMAFTVCVLLIGAAPLLGVASNWFDNREREQINQRLASVHAQTEPTRKRIADNAQASAGLGSLAAAQERGPEAEKAWKERKAALVKESSDLDSLLAAMKQTLGDAQRSSDAMRQRAESRDFWLLMLIGLLSIPTLILGLTMWKRGLQ